MTVHRRCCRRFQTEVRQADASRNVVPLPIQYAGWRSCLWWKAEFCDTLDEVSSERAAEVMRKIVAMFSTGNLSPIEETVHPDYHDHQALHG
jgi:hypothetical protein